MEAMFWAPISQYHRFAVHKGALILWCTVSVLWMGHGVAALSPSVVRHSMQTTHWTALLWVLNSMPQQHFLNALLTEVCQDVAVTPVLQPSWETFNQQSIVHPSTFKQRLLDSQSRTEHLPWCQVFNKSKHILQPYSLLWCLLLLLHMQKGQLSRTCIQGMHPWSGVHHIALRNSQNYLSGASLLISAFLKHLATMQAVREEGPGLQHNNWLASTLGCYVHQRCAFVAPDQQRVAYAKTIIIKTIYCLDNQSPMLSIVSLLY